MQSDHYSWTKKHKSFPVRTVNIHPGGSVNAVTVTKREFYFFSMEVQGFPGQTCQTFENMRNFILFMQVLKQMCKQKY